MPYPKFDYPKPAESKCGCKVSWYTYETRDEAEQASKVAQVEARHRAGLGFDFGWCIPGEITECKDGRWLVTIP